MFGIPLVFLFFSENIYSDTATQQVVCIQPFEETNTTIVTQLSRSIEFFFAFSTKTLPHISLPHEAYVASRNRYSAPKIVDFLVGVKPTNCDYILGFTRQDISMPLEPEGDYGIMGWADVFGGYAAIVSDFRIKNLDKIDSRKNLVKTALHEIVHTYGFYHHSDPKCLMAEWSNRLDHETVYLCPETREYILEKSGLTLPNHADFDWSILEIPGN